MRTFNVCLALVAQLTLISAVPLTSDIPENLPGGAISTSAQLSDYLQAHKDNDTLGAINSDKFVAVVAAALAANTTLPDHPETQLTSLLGNPAESAVITGDDGFSLSLRRYREPSTTIEQAKQFAGCTLASWAINQLIARAADDDEVEDGRYFFRGEAQFFRPSLFVSIRGIDGTLTWAQLKAYSQILLKWTEEYDSGTVTGLEGVLLDRQQRAVANTLFMVNPTAGGGSA